MHKRYREQKKQNKKEIVEDRYSYDHSICGTYDQNEAKNKIQYSFQSFNDFDVLNIPIN